MNPVLLIRAACMGLAAIGGGIFGIGIYYGIQEPLVKRVERRHYGHPSTDADAVRYVPGLVDIDEAQDRLDRIEAEIDDDQEAKR